MANTQSKRPGIFVESDQKSFFAAAKDVVDELEEESFCLLDEGKLKKRVAQIKEHFLADDQFKDARKVIYAIKANPIARIIQIMNEAGIDGFDCASLREIEHVQQLSGQTPVFFNNPIKRKKEIEAAMRRGVSSYTVQRRREIEKIISLAEHAESENVEVSIRMITDNPSAAINLSDKYGASETETLRLLRSVKADEAIQRRGLSIHAGSQNTDFLSFQRAIEAMCSVARSAGGVDSLNLGGGIPIQPFSRNHAREVIGYVRWISEMVRQNIHGVLRGDDPNIILELGRSLVADSVDLVIPVLSSEKRNGENCLYISDGLFTSFMDDAVHGWEYPILPFPRLNKKPYQPELAPFRIFGRTCDSGDRLKPFYSLPSDIGEGDYIHVPCAGAYMDSQSTHFNGFEPPKYVSYNLV